MKYTCELCGLIYDEAAGLPERKIPAGTAFSDLPADFYCPSCGSEKEAFCKTAPRQSASAAHDQSFWHGVKYSDTSFESDR